MLRLRCFVAMALGHEETDGVYDRLIAPTLRKESIISIRIDRIQHNEDIDDKIISELAKCDLVLADLTLARPSVYFEAGYAQRQVPVIYTCRRDHLRPRANDPFGNYRVHFDLQMKNIISWVGSDDRSFVKRLRKRISLVAKPILRAKLDAQEQAQAVEKFDSLSLNAKIGMVRKIAITQMRRAGFKGTGPPEGVGAWVGVKRLGRRANLASLIILTSASQKSLAAMTAWSGFTWIVALRKLLPAPEKRRVQSVAEHYLVFSLRKIPRRRADSAFPRFRFDGGKDLYVGTEEQFALEVGQVVPSTVYIHLIDGIDSELSLKGKLLSILEKMRH